jgi:type I restriction enzyme S subunit
MSDGWEATTLGEVADLIVGRTPPRKDERYWTVDLERPFCTIADMGAIDVLPEREGVTEAAEIEGKAKRVPAGSLLMSFKLTIGRVGFAAVDLFPNEAIVWIKPREGVPVVDRYLALWLSHLDLTESAGRAVKGQALNGPSLRAIPVDLPSLVVQRRVVDLVDALDTYAAAARARHETARAARNAVISERLLQGSGDGWERTTLGEAAEVTIGRQRSPKNATGDHMTNYLRAANVKDGYLDLSDVKEMNFSPHEQDTYGLRPGDVLVTEGCGSLAQLGACAVWNGGAYEGPVCFQNTLIRLRSTERTDPGFLGLWGQWAFETGLFASIATGTNIFHLGVEQTRRLPLHLPPIPVQRDLSALASAFGSEIEGSAAAEKAALATRSALLDELLSGEREVPGSYDELVGLVA